MNNKILAAICLLCLAPAAAFAQSATTFQHSVDFSTSVKTATPPKCNTGQSLTYDGSQYKCTDKVQNNCGDGKTLIGGVCKDLYKPVNCQTSPSVLLQGGATGPGSPNYVQLGTDGQGNAICGLPPSPQCHIVHAQNPNAGGNFISHADCDTNHGEFLLSGGGNCAMPFSVKWTKTAAWCLSMGGGGWGFLHRSQLIKDANPGVVGDAAWMTDCYFDPNDLGGGFVNSDANDCSNSYAICCKYPNDNGAIDTTGSRAPAGTNTGPSVGYVAGCGGAGCDPPPSGSGPAIGPAHVAH